MSGLLPVEEAQARLLALGDPLPIRTAPLAETLGHYLAAPLTAQRSQPDAALSAMDGYAIRFADLPGPWQLAGHIAAGQLAARALAPGEAMRIFTGAPLPAGADTVLVQEDAAAADGRIILTGSGPAACGQHVRASASDFAAGELLADSGTEVTARLIALAAMAGHAKLPARTPARVALLATGDELVPPGTLPAPGKIPESNGIMLAALLAPLPCRVTPAAQVCDDLAATAAALAAAAETHDVIVTIGGASVGDHDHVHAALTSLGAPPSFWKVAMRPGKPLLAARLGGAVVLGLPGNPASAFVTATLFLLPLIRHLSGAAHPLPAIGQAILAEPLAGGGARRDYLRARLAGGTIAPLPAQDSGLVATLARANALLIREAEAPPSAAGTLAPYIAI